MTGAEMIATERERQMHVLGYSPGGDDAQQPYSLTNCARFIVNDLLYDGLPRAPETWERERANHVRAKYGTDYVRRLTIAGALIAAEIDRLLRAKDTTEK